MVVVMGINVYTIAIAAFLTVPAVGCLAPAVTAVTVKAAAYLVAVARAAPRALRALVGTVRLAASALA